MQSPIITPTRRNLNRKRYTKQRRALAWLAAVLAVSALAVLLIA